MSLQLDGRLVLVGAGKMGGALLAGMLERGLSVDDVVVQDPGPPADVAEALGRLGIVADAAPGALERPASVVIVAVKPHLVAKVLPDVSAKFVGADTLVVSVAAGVTLENLEKHLSDGTAVVRAMPNTPAAIGQGMTVCCGNTHVASGARALCETLLSAVGATAWVDNESQMDAVTAVSGSGPAYVFFMAECLAQAGVKAGLSAELAAKLADETVAGAGALLKASREDAATLRTNVTSKGGTTAAALGVLMNEPGGMRTLFGDAVSAAAARSREMARGE